MRMVLFGVKKDSVTGTKQQDKSTHLLDASDKRLGAVRDLLGLLSKKKEEDIIM